MGAPSRVFTVFELLEAVLIDVPLFDLVQATTICHTFHDTISSSKRLRDRLEREPVPLFAPLCPGRPETEDICNVDNTSPWFFRTLVEHGIVLVLQTKETDIQLFVPNDRKQEVSRLHSRRTTGSYVETAYKTIGWAEWYDDQARLVCSKELSASRFVIQKPDSLWSYLKKVSTGDRPPRNETKPPLEKRRCSRAATCRNKTTGYSTRVRPETCHEDSGQKMFEELYGWLTD